MEVSGQALVFWLWVPMVEIYTSVKEWWETGGAGNRALEAQQVALLGSCCRKGHGVSGASMTKCDLRRGVSWGRSVDGRPQVIKHQYSIRVCLLPALLDENHAWLCYWVQEPVTGQIVGPRRENTVIILLNAHIKLNPNDLFLYPQISISQPLSERLLLK